MVLIIEIKENSTTIRCYSAQRLSEKREGVNNYLIQEYHKPENSRAVDLKNISRIGILDHCYEDGADILALKVMKLVTNKNKKSRERKSLKESDYVPMSEFMKTDDIP